MNNNNDKLAIFIFLSIISLPITSFSNQITGIAPEKLSQGNQATITGHGFGVKSPAPPIIWANFENGTTNPSTLGQLNAWSGTGNLVINSTNNNPGSGNNVVGIWDSTQGRKSFSFSVVKKYWSTVYHFQKRYWDFDVTANQKYWRLWPASGGNDMIAAWLWGGGVAYNEFETSGYIGGTIGGYQGSFPGKNQWHTEEFTWKFAGGTGLDSAGSPDGRGCTGYWNYRVDGITNQHRENVCNGTNNQELLHTDNFTDSANLPPDGSKVYMDDIYIDDTLARVMIGNASSLAASTHVEPQIPSTWSDTSITITVNQGSFQKGESMYLFVVDAAGNASAGHPISMGVTGPQLNSIIIK